VRSRSKLFRAFGVLALGAALAVLAAGCGGGGKKSSSGSGNGNAGNSSGKTFAVLNVVWDAPDYMDPGLYYTVAAYQLTNYVWTGLVGYKHTSGPASAELVPYLAESMPKVAADGKTYTFTLRPNLKYSNGKLVSASTRTSAA
jgi:peptide/nickel transport system substrate-binding protein